jgi:hypothetical protein
VHDLRRTVATGLQRLGVVTTRNVTKNQIIRVVTATLDRLPERLDEAFPTLVVEALIQTRPFR